MSCSQEKILTSRSQVQGVEVICPCEVSPNWILPTNVKYIKRLRSIAMEGFAYILIIVLAIIPLWALTSIADNTKKIRKLLEQHLSEQR
jgi:hypothetical protein